jgi:hypothetical protein
MMGWTCSSCGETRNSCRFLARNSLRKRFLGKPGQNSEDNIKMDIKDLVYEDVNWIKCFRTCSVRDFGISGVESAGSVTQEQLFR